MTKRYVLTEAAETDLRGVVRYTMQRWGEPQVRRYIADLELGIARLAEGDGPFKELSTLYTRRCGWRTTHTTTSSACPVRAHQR